MSEILKKNSLSFIVERNYGIVLRWYRFRLFYSSWNFPLGIICGGLSDHVLRRNIISSHSASQNPSLPFL